ncbi:IclR family transcriptional regulator [Roseibium marinum]|uniref:DNA-binding IclR family transcriptional regulator n=1 Tax=Roseibium marinum TaxID=281252 RepID=A0A2S3UMV7_9HYPH|nr:IclR family transcriptional regulator [Roseibium marinum]POF29058.1 DNA-binding IclR family transcriptional regulator [Roseibium marinum]
MSAEDDEDTQGPARKRSGNIQSVSIATRFLNILANGSEPMALGVIARKAGTGSPTAHRYLQSLVKEGLVMQDPQTGFYDLGPTALSIGIGALKRIDPVDIAGRHTKKLASGLAASAGVAIWTERGPTVVRWYRSALFSISSVGLGDVLPVDNSACGLVFQAFLPDKQIDVARKLQPTHFRGKRPSRETLETVRSTCWAELTDHLLPGITGQAVPVFDAQQEIACVMTTVTNLGLLHKPEDRKALLDCAKQAARETGGTAAFSLK